MGVHRDLEGLGRGERAPDFVLPCGGTPTRFYGCAGGAPTVLVFPPIHAEDNSPALFEALTELTTFVVARREPKTKLGCASSSMPMERSPRSTGCPKEKGGSWCWT